MDSTLVEFPGQTTPASRREVELSARLDRLLDEVGGLRREVAELRQEAGYWKGMFAQAKRKNEKLQSEIDELRAENRQLKDKLYGTKSEKKSSQDRSNQLEDPSKPHSAPKRSRGHQRGKPGALVQRSSWSSFSLNLDRVLGVNDPHYGRRPMTTSCYSTQKDGFDAISAHRCAHGDREEPCYATRRSLTTGRCRRLSWKLTIISNRWPGFPATSAWGLAQGEPRGQCSRGSILGLRLSG